MLCFPSSLWKQEVPSVDHWSFEGQLLFGWTFEEVGTLCHRLS